MTRSSLVGRGDVWTAGLAPRFGSEPGKTRPVVVVQTDLLNPHHASTLICPVTTKVGTDDSMLRVRLKTGEAGVVKESDVMVDQLRAIDNSRFQKLVGKLPTARLEELRKKIVSVINID